MVLVILQMPVETTRVETSHVMLVSNGLKMQEFPKLHF